MERRLRALRYMTRFKCIAQACEDTCCAGMKILLTPANHERLQAAMSRDSAEREEHAAKVHASAELPEGFQSVFAMHEDGSCSFLEADRLCSVWKRHGEAVLPDACSLFPRVLSHLEDHVEVAATLACPEAARLCLLADDSLDMVEAAPSVTERVPPIARRGSPEPYVRHIEDVRACGLELLGRTRAPLPARLAVLAELGSRTAGFFHRGAPDFDETRLRGELARVLQPEAQDAVSHRLHALPQGDGVVQAIVGLITSLQPAGSARYHQLTTAILNRYLEAAAQLAPTTGQPGGPTLFATLHRVFDERRGRLDEVLGQKVEQYFTRYCINEWHREWYTHSPNLLSHAFKLLLRLACLRFLLAGHPALEVAPGDPSLVEHCVVDVVQIFTKQVERDPQIMALMDLHLTPESLGVDALGRALLFAQASY